MDSLTSLIIAISPLYSVSHNTSQLLISPSSFLLPELPPLLCGVVPTVQPESIESVEPATPAPPMTLRNLPREILVSLRMANLLVLDSFRRPRPPKPRHPLRDRGRRGRSAGRARSSPRQNARLCTGC